MSVKKEQQYIITELELKTFHMAAILAGGTNRKAQEVVDGIRKRKISETMEAVEQPLTQQSKQAIKEIAARVKQKGVEVSNHPKLSINKKWYFDLARQLLAL